MPIIPDLPSVQGDWRPATPSLRTAMAPGFAMADLGQDIGTVANVATEISRKIQNVADEDGFNKAELALIEADAQRQLFRNNNPDPSRWLENDKLKFSEVREKTKDFKLSGEARTKLNAYLDTTEQKGLFQTKVDIAKYQITTARQNLRQLTEKQIAAGGHEAAIGKQQQAVKSGLQTPEQAQANIEDIRQHQTQAQKTKFLATTKSIIDSNPLRWLEENTTRPPDLSEDQYPLLLEHARNVHSQDVVEATDTLLPAIDSGQITSKEELWLMSGENRTPDETHHFENYFHARQQSRANGSVLRGPDLNQTVGTVSALIYGYEDQPELKNRRFIQIAALTRQLPEGDTKNHLLSQFKRLRQGMPPEINNDTGYFMHQLNELYQRGTFGDIRQTGISTQSTLSALNDGFLQDTAKLTKAGLPEESAHTIAQPDLWGGTDARTKLFREQWGKLPPNQRKLDQLPPMERAAFEAIRDDKPEIQWSTQESIAAAQASQIKAHETYGRIQEALLPWIKVAKPTHQEISSRILELAHGDKRDAATAVPFKTEL